MSERPSATYQCQNLGCPNGHLSTFTGAPPEWFVQRGLTPPKGCPDCRAWIKSQTDSASRCYGCGYIIRQPAKYKISHHKRKGVYKPPNECRQCELGRELGKKAVLEVRKFEERSRKSSDSERFLKAFKKAGFDSPSHRNFITDERAYSRPQIRGSQQTRRQHLEVHAPYTQHVQRQEKRKTTKTDFGGATGNFSAYLRGINSLAAETRPDRALELEQGNRIVKIDLETHDLVVLRLEDPGPPPVHSAVTTYKADLEDAKRYSR